MAKAATPAQLAAAANRLNPARVHEESAMLERSAKRYNLQIGVFLKSYRDLIEYNRNYRAVGGNDGRARGLTLGAKFKPFKRVDSRP